MFSLLAEQATRPAETLATATRSNPWRPKQTTLHVHELQQERRQFIGLHATRQGSIQASMSIRCENQATLTQGDGVGRNIVRYLHHLKTRPHEVVFNSSIARVLVCLPLNHRIWWSSGEIRYHPHRPSAVRIRQGLARRRWCENG